MPGDAHVDIVWAEDSAGDRFLIQTVLDEMRPAPRVTFAIDGVAALELVARHKPRLVVLDVKMPRASGVTVLERIRSDPSLAKTRVAVFSSSAQPGEIGQVRALGALGFFQKPTDFAAFRQVVTTLAADARRPDEAPSLLSSSGQHHVLFWESESDLVDSVAQFLERGRHRGDGLIVLAKPERLSPLKRILAGADVVWLDANEVHKSIRAGGRADPERFAAMFGQAMEKASLGGKRPVSCFGELVAILQANGESASALAIEAIGQAAAAQNPTSLAILCAYPTTAFAEMEEMGATCLVHTGHFFTHLAPVSPALRGLQPSA